MAEEAQLFQQIIAALIAQQPLEQTEAACVEALVRSGGAVAATVVQLNGPDQLNLFRSRRDPNGAVEDHRSVVRARFSILLNRTAMLDLCDSKTIQSDCQIYGDPIQGFALIVESTNRLHDQSDIKSSWQRTLIDASVTLLSRNSPIHGQFPDARHLEAMAEFAAGAGHEINNPLASILGQTALLLKGESSVDRRQALETIGGQGWRIRDMIGNTMLFARPPQPNKTRLQPNEVLRSLIASIQEDARYAGIRFEFAADSSGVSLTADAGQLNSLFSYLIRNAAEEVRNSETAGVVEVRLAGQPENQTVEFSVTDSSQRHIPPEERRHMFDPFYSGRSAGRGLGFGLSLAWQIVRQHQGTLFCMMPDEGGLKSYVALPTADLSD